MSSRMSLVEVPSLGPGSCSLASSTVAQWQRRSRAASSPSREMDTSRHSATNGGGCERRPGGGVVVQGVSSGGWRGPRPACASVCAGQHFNMHNNTQSSVQPAATTHLAALAHGQPLDQV